MPEVRHLRSHMFRTQHRELLELARDLRELLDPARLAIEGSRARTLLSMLAGKLSVHMAMEDKAFYARLLQHKNAKVRERATKLLAEANGVHAAFDAYVARWPTAQGIQANGRQFALETQQIFDALSARIQQEHDWLFPALDDS
jgi:hypothetical protein